MTEQKNYRLEIKATEQEFCLDKLDTVERNKNFEPGQSNEPVPNTVIGYWVDVVSSDCKVLFRQYLNNLPINLPHSWQLWGKRKRKNARFVIEVPVIDSAAWIQLYEQRIQSSQQRTMQRQKHFQCAI